jgi:hypothetical protein
MDDTPKGWKGKAKRPAKVAGGVTLAGALMFAATELRGLVVDYVRATEKQAAAVEEASKKFDRGIRLVERRTEREIRRLEDREDRKDERVFLAIQAHGQDLRDLRRDLHDFMKESRRAQREEMGGRFGRAAQSAPEGDPDSGS